ncbi:baculoviral IAP repeat-containing protein 5b [Esox lucius]|uniref:Baculoviral IAP repeat-containing protein 5.1 n=1 Tax=Esox lucius TaxID=8010 RepID=A0A3P8XYZ3_ESOLU|nr:baculoviral IAP repeat-containing protein 5b [Esox lucius]
MDVPNEMSLRFHSYSDMYIYDKRLQSFADWPFREECQCTPEMMAKTGFVHCPSENEPDVACCFFCLRELEGWEPEDNPWSEHIKRSPNCGFLAMKKDFCELTVAEFYHLEQQRLCIYIRKTINLKMAKFVENVASTREYVQTLFGSMPVIRPE